jgi:hypothetical protein
VFRIIEILSQSTVYNLYLFLAMQEAAIVHKVS